jgi:hypothetical protein
MSFLADLGLDMLFVAGGFEKDPNVLRGTPIRNAVGWFVSAVLALIPPPCPHACFCRGGRSTSGINGY